MCEDFAGTGGTRMVDAAGSRSLTRTEGIELKSLTSYRTARNATSDSPYVQDLYKNALLVDALLLVNTH